MNVDLCSHNIVSGLTLSCFDRSDQCDHNNMGNKDIIIQILVLILNIDTTDTPDNIDNTDTTTNNEYWSNYTNIHNANNCYL